MAQSVWLATRKAREALAADRPDEAHRLIEPLLAEGYRRAWRVAREVVAKYIDRANRHLNAEPPDDDAAWAELFSAEALNTGEKAITALRLTLTRFGLTQARVALEAGDPVAAIEAAGRLRERAVRHPELNQIEEAGRRWLDAAGMADRGEFRQALSALDEVGPKLTCPPTGFDRFKGAVADRHARFRTAVDRLYDAAESRRWREVLAVAEEVLSAAPEHREAKHLQSRAWQAVEPPTDDWKDAGSGRGDGENGHAAYVRPTASVVPFGPSPSVSPLASSPPLLVSSSPRLPPTPIAAGVAPKRFLLWVDDIAMGGFLVCLGDRVTFGLGTEGGPIDIPLYAAMSRFQAEITRDREGYVVSSTHAVRVNDRDVTRAGLTPGDRITLGANFQFVFHKPVAVSSTAWLQITSGHRLVSGAESVLLMGNDLVLGPPGAPAHVTVGELPKPVLLFRSKDSLAVRFDAGPYTIDNRPCSGASPLPVGAVVDGEGFRFSLEPVGPRL